MSFHAPEYPSGDLPLEVREQLLNLRKLEAQIGDLEEKLQDVRNQRDKVYRWLERFTQSTSPIRRVPNEVLTAIFENHSNDQKYRNSSLLLVCKLWYEIVMCTPTLWNNIVLDLKRLEELPMLWEYSRDCLTRSGKIRLSIQLNADDFDPEHVFINAANLFHSAKYRPYSYRPLSSAGRALESTNVFGYLGDTTMVYECSLLMTLAILRGEDDVFLTRWRAFSCNISPFTSSGLLSRVWDSIDGITTNLEVLEILQDDEGNAGLTGIPNLTSLKGLSTTLEVSLDHLALPTVQLERLILWNAVSSIRLLELATTAFPSLQLLQINICHDGTGLPQGHSPPLHLPALKVLALSDQWPETLMKKLDAPKLTHFSFFRWVPSIPTSPCFLNTITDLMWNEPLGESIPADLRRLISSCPSLRVIHHSIARIDDIVSIDIPAILEDLNSEGGPAVHFTKNQEDWPYVIPCKFRNYT